MFDKTKAKAIGKVHIKDFNALREWLCNDEGKYYMDNNWSEAKNKQLDNNWQEGIHIGFYNLQDTIPFLSEVYCFYKDIQDKSWGEHRLNRIMQELQEFEDYYTCYNQSFDLLYDGGSYAVFCSQKDVWLFPAEFLEIEKFKNYDNISINELKSIAGPKNESGLIPKGLDISVCSVKSEIDKRKEDIQKAKDDLENLEKEKEEELRNLNWSWKQHTKTNSNFCRRKKKN